MHFTEPEPLNQMAESASASIDETVPLAGPLYSNPAVMTPGVQVVPEKDKGKTVSFCPLMLNQAGTQRECTGVFDFWSLTL